MKIKNIMLVSFSILTLISLSIFIVVFVAGRSYLHVSSGYVLTEEFVNGFVMRSHYWGLISKSVISFVLSGAGIFVSIFWDKITDSDDPTGLKTLFIKGLLILFLSIFPIIAIAGIATEGLPTLASKPYVVTVTMTDKYTREEYDGINNNRSRVYYLEFSNGIRCKVSDSDYERYRSYHDYYMIMQNGKCFAFFDVDEYSLP